MYWYVKYPLIAILVLAVVGLSALVWKSLRKAPSPDTEQVIIMTSEDSANGGSAESVIAATGNEDATAGRSDLPSILSDEYQAIEDKLEKAEAQLQAGSLESARQLARIAMNMDGCVEYDKYWFRAFDVINEADRKFMNSGAPCVEKKRYTVQPGDNLTKIADRHYVSIESIGCINNIDVKKPLIRPGQVIAYLDGVWSIKVSKRQFVLTLYLDRQPYRYYRIGIGRENRTPVGTFLINSRIWHPAWTPPGKNIPFGEPENVLGTCWLGLVPTGNTDPTLSGYGIHGTWEPDSIGTASSSGCVRMRNEDVEELFSFMPQPGGSCPPVQVLIQE